MKNYILIYRAPPGGPVPKDPNEGMKVWAQWFQKLEADGVIVDPGNGFTGNAKVISPKGITDERSEFKDGMFLMGYTVIKANDLDAAAKIAASSPAVEQQCSIEVREAMQKPNS